MSVIEYKDVEVAIGRPISDIAEQDQVNQWIEDVEMILGARLDLEELDEGVQAGLVEYVVREAVIARMRHRSETTDQADEPGADSHFFLNILEPWWALLDPGESGSAAFSVRPYFDADPAVYAINAWEIA